MHPRTALLVTAHGTPSTLDEIAPFLDNIRRGRATPPEVVDEVRRRYEAIGGRSPLLDITTRQAAKLGVRLGMPAYVAMRLWHPYVSEVLPRIVADGIERVVSVPIAPYSVDVYHSDVARAFAALPDAPALLRAPAWHVEPALLGLLASEVRRAIDGAGANRRVKLVLTAHSLPVRVIRAGDAYATLVEQTANVLGERLAGVPWTLAYQSQGMSSDEWLGPDLASAFEQAERERFDHVVVAPIGFLADHVEVLYDLDIEAVQLAQAHGLTLSRTRTPNDADGLIDALATAVTRALASADARATTTAT